MQIKLKSKVKMNLFSGSNQKPNFKLDLQILPFLNHTNFRAISPRKRRLSSGKGGWMRKLFAGCEEKAPPASSSGGRDGPRLDAVGGPSGG